ncbi:MAG: ABC transporter permease [Patescibacteria group bacterium]
MMQTTVIKPKKTLTIDTKELWRYRELFYYFGLRDIMVRYKQTALGIAWAVLQPLIMMAILNVLFSKVIDVDTGGIPYPVFSFIGLLFWYYFANSLGSAANSLIADQSIIKKVYFPKIILPLASTFVHLIDFGCAFIILLCLMLYYHMVPGIWGIVLLIPCLLITFLTFSGIGLMLAAINVKYRDVRYALPFGVQLLFFVTPIMYPLTFLGSNNALWYLNPIGSSIEIMRVALTGAGDIQWYLLSSAGIVSVLLFLCGLFIFNRTEKYFADIL